MACKNLSANQHEPLHEQYGINNCCLCKAEQTITELRKQITELQFNQNNNQWINVKDRLPDNNDRVIICSMTSINDYAYPYDYKDSCEMGFYENDKWYSDTKFDILAQIEMKIMKRKKMKPVDAKCWFIASEVTHWMPLPEQPTI